MIHDQIVCGDKSTIIGKKLLAERDGQTIHWAITIYLAYETTQAQLKIFEKKQETKQEVDAVSRNWRRSTAETPKCYFCGGKYTRNYLCRAKGKTCSKEQMLCKNKAFNFVEYLYSENSPSGQLPGN
ncbi:hypothetical protein QYM36_007774 [Artemia franciscana]|uniref:Uncharacterized protein n=1 Tax=Artemia franciscana TaxID=6661 RepID=A0AA88I9Y1_ARTSF|nr:hypothetical protein QYM36_007774 [Artemia franciscana]